MKPRQKRFVLIGLGLVAVAVAAVLVLNAFQSNLVFFFTPTQVANGEVPQGRSFRIGGMVESGSLTREGDGLTVHFIVTDMAKRVPVMFKGILPDLFKEGKGAVAQGQLGADGTFIASEVLAKHDENY
ncbi:MAG: cytochrome c maturation protein CcmE, partial [Nitrospiraceae bacterium]